MAVDDPTARDDDETGLSDEAAPGEAGEEEIEPPSFPSATLTFRISSILAVLCVCVLMGLLQNYKQTRDVRRAQTIEESRLSGVRAATQITAELHAVEKAVRELPAQSTEASLTQALAACPAASALMAVGEDGRALRVARDPEMPDEIRVTAVEGSEVEQTRALLGTPGWQPPAVSNRRIVVRYLQPSGGGFVGGEFSVRQLKSIVDAADVSTAGYGLVVTADGRFLTAPLGELVLGGATVAETAAQTHVLVELGALKFPQGEAVIETADDLGPRTAITIPVAPVNWTLILVITTRDSFTDDLLGRLWALVILTVTATATFVLLAILSRGVIGGMKGLWTGSIGISLLILSAILGIWGLVIAGYLKNFDTRSVRMVDRASVERFEARYTAHCKKNNLPVPLFIPTGVFVETLEFTNANNVTMTGIVWQKYSAAARRLVKPGLQFPEAVSIKFEEIYRGTDRDTEIVGWRFQGVMRQRFDYGRYPFDLASAWIRIWSTSLRQDVLCVPDVDGYRLLRPFATPGVQDDFVLAGWMLQSSAFEYREHIYNTDFGLGTLAGNRAPDLYFAIDLRRDFLLAFLLYMVPMLVIAVLIFALVLTTTYDKERSDIYGIKPSSVLTTCSGLLFAALLAHTRLRTDFAAQTSVIYLETFYFVLYILLMLVPMNSFLIATRAKSRWARFEDNALPKLCFWPVLLLVTLGLTLYYFL